MKAGSGGSPEPLTAAPSHPQPTGSRQEEETSPTARIDFRASEFNIVDDLDDNLGNYRTFQALDGIVTADMRHREARRKRTAPSAPSVSYSPVAAEKEIRAKETADDNSFPPLYIVSKGRTLIVGADIDLLLHCGKKLQERGLTCTLCASRAGGRDTSRAETTPPYPFIEADRVTVSGCFGGFSALLYADGEQTEFSTLPGQETSSFDLVLDLQPEPSYTGEQPPIGYYAPAATNLPLEEALAELPEMRGRFRKPQFTVFHRNRCLHGRSKSHACRRCLETCPFEAVRSDGLEISIDPFLCQGCGGCALVCPADAIRLREPDGEDLLSSLRELIIEAGPEKTPPDLVIHDHSIDRETVLALSGGAGIRAVFFGIEEIGRAGLDMLLAVLAFGAGSVTLACAIQRPQGIKQALEREAELGRVILAGLALAADRINFIVPGAGTADPVNRHFARQADLSGPVEPPVAPAVFPSGLDKRTLVRLAARHLFEASDGGDVCFPLSDGAPFGAVAIDGESCSLCMACVSSCPASALAASSDSPRVSFVESRCHQCGLCKEVCPEGAIRLQPRLLCDTERADAPNVLIQVEPFRCTECGEPFASQAMIDRMENKLRGHWMYSSDRQIQRLRMCRTCRTRDALSNGDYRL